MDSNLPPSPPDSGFGKAAFRKPSNDVVNRKYRRRSPVDRSSSSEGSPNGARSSIPVHSKENPAKSFDDRQRKDDRRDIDREYGRSQHGRTSDSHKHNDRHSSRSINNHSRRDDYRREKYVDEDGRKYPRLTSRSDYTSRDNEQNSRREDKHYTDKYPRGKTDSSGHRSRDRDGGTSPLEYQKNKDSSDRVGSGKRQTDSSTGVKSGELDIHRGIKHDHNDKRDYQRIVGDHRSDLLPKLEFKGRHNSASRRDIPEHQQRETSRAENKELETQEYSKEEKEKHNLEYEMHKEKYSREVAEKSESRNTFTSEGQEKKPRLFSSDGSKDQSKNVSKVTTAADEKGPLNPQKTQIGVGKVTQDQKFLKDSDIDAAKVAAMKAAEQVNKNLIGTGYMTADQKKKLLWGNKKSTTVEESTHRWDTTMFSDLERQEKFNKLMTLRLHWYLWPIVGCEGRAKGGTQTKTRQPRGKWHRPSREAESATAGFGKAIYSWAAPKRWPYSWTGSVGTYLEIFLTLLNRSCTLLYNLEVLGLPTCEFIFLLDNLSILTGDL